jgi:hypothetical protein
MSVADRIRRRCSVMAIPNELLVERGGRVVATLDEPLLEDMFWLKWRVTPVGDGPNVMSNGFWSESELGNTVFRCKASGLVADTAMWALSNPFRDGRLVLRGAYVPTALRFRSHPVEYLRMLCRGGGAYEQLAEAE